MLTRIDHIGVACRSLESAIDRYQSVFGLTLASIETNAEQGVREAMLIVADAPAGTSYVQLLEPLGPETPVGRFLERRGEGIHHVGYGVPDVGAALAEIGATGIRLIDARPRHGSMGASIAFLHPADLGGVLTELVQSGLNPKILHLENAERRTHHLTPDSGVRCEAATLPRLTLPVSSILCSSQDIGC